MLSCTDGQVVDEVLAGIEEEGVPAVVERPRTPGDAMALARTAAGRSSLSVGVGIAVDGQVSVHHDKLPSPLAELASDGPAESDTARVLGHNAARIVVGIPLRAQPLPMRAGGQERLDAGTPAS